MAGVGLQWNVDGTRATATTPPPSPVRSIAVVNAPTTPVPTLTMTNTGTALRISWPLTNLSYQLQAQTNALSIGLSNNWVGISGSEATNVWTVPVDTNNPAVFFRLSNQ